MNVMRTSMLLLAAALAGLGLAPHPALSQATDPSALAPYRFQPPPTQLSPLEQQKALMYRSQLQNQLRQLEQQRALGGPRAVDQHLLLDTRRELGRMNGLVRPGQ